MVSRFLTLALLLGSVLASQAQFKSLVVEEVDNKGEVPGRTYRVYAQMEGEGDVIDAVFGDGADYLEVSSTAPFYQHELGANSANDLQRATVQSEPGLKYDSWVTIGLEDQGGNALSEIGLIHDDASGTSTSDGSFYVTPDDAQGAEVDGRVLIAQFTTFGYDSALVGTISLQGKNADGSNWGAESVSYDFALPAPGALALLGLAGVAGRRRRRA